MAKILYLMQGIPGSGKTTIAKEIRAQTAGVILSTDDFWYEVTEGDTTYRGDTYKFDRSRLGEAHQWNQKRAEDSMRFGASAVIIDNTNIRARDVIPYVVAARIHGYDIQVRRVDVDPQVAIARQEDRPEDRRIPAETINRMYDEMEDLL